MSTVEKTLNNLKENNLNSTIIFNLCGFSLQYKSSNTEIYNNENEEYITFDLDEKYITVNENIHIEFMLISAINARMLELGWFNKNEC